MNQIATVPANDDGTDEVPDSLIQFLARAVRDPGIDVSKLQAIYQMQREIVADDRRERFHEAMNAVQGEMQAVVRNTKNTETGSKYATLEAVDAAIRPIYAKHGFSLSFSEANNDDGPEIKIQCVVRRGGHEETHHLSAMSDTVGPKGTPNKTNVQGVGSSVSYLRRYLTCMIFNIALRDDNDGNRQRANDIIGDLPTRAQVDELYKLLAECSADPTVVGANERSFLAKMGMPHVRTLKDIPAGQFARCRNALISKRNIIQRKTGAAA